MSAVRAVDAVRLGKAIQRLRAAAGLSRAEVSERAWKEARTSLVALPSIERGRRTPTPHQLEALRRVFDLDFLVFSLLLGMAQRARRDVPEVGSLFDWQAWLVAQTPAPPRTRLVAAPYPGGIHLRAMNASQPMKVRVTSEEAALIKDAAARAGKQVASWLHDVVLDAAEESDATFHVPLQPRGTKIKARKPMPYRLPQDANLMRRLDRLRNGTPLALWVRYLVVDRARRAVERPLAQEPLRATGT